MFLPHILSFLDDLSLVTHAGQVRMSPESDSSDSESVEGAAEMTTEKKSPKKDEEETKREKQSPFEVKDARRSQARSRRRDRSASRGRDRRRRSRSHGKRKRRSEGHTRTDRKTRRTWETCWVKVSDILDQGEARAYEAGDVDAAKQVLRLNKLIQTCLHPTWEMVSSDATPEKTILCSVSDWGEDWSRFKHCLTGYHLQEFRTVAADLKRLEEYGLSQPEASWTSTAQLQVLDLLAECEELHRARH